MENTVIKASKDTIDTLENFVNQTPRKEIIYACVKKILLKGLFNCNDKNFFKPIKIFESISENTAAVSTKEEIIEFKIAVIAALALNLLSSLDKLILPNSILELYPQSLFQLKEYYISNKSVPYNIDYDYYCKDIRFVLGISIPCGALVVDKMSRITPLSVLLSIMRSRQVYPALEYIRNGGYGLWFRIHTAPRNIQEFNEYNWDKCYNRIVDLLLRRSNIKGMVGTSWFYDPQILKISPRLAYLQKKPIENGAFALKHGTSKIDIERAIAKSPTRKRLFEEGKYRPVSYSILWPRNKMIVMARSQTKEIKHENNNPTYFG